MSYKWNGQDFNYKFIYILTAICLFTADHSSLHPHNAMPLVAVIGHVWIRDPWHCVDVMSQPMISPMYQLRHLPCYMYLSFSTDPNQRLISKQLVQIHGSVLYCLHQVTILKINEFTSCLSSWTEKPMITQMTHKMNPIQMKKWKLETKAVSKMTRHNYQYASFGLKNGLLLLLMFCNYSHSLKNLFSKLPFASSSYIYN